MPVLISPRETRSPLVAESPPRKKFKFSLKLKAKNKAKAKNPIDSDSAEESEKEMDDLDTNFEGKVVESSSCTMSTNRVSKTTLGVQSETVIIPPLPYTGLANLGNTCYLNAVLQVLRYCPGFLQSLVNLDELSAENCPVLASEGIDDTDLSEKPSVIHNICKLINLMENAEKNYKKFGLEAREVKTRSGCTTLAVHPKDFVNGFSGLCPLFAGYQQHDAQEFLRSFLSLIEEECIGLVEGEQQENTKGSTSVVSNESKVRGGCKYPGTVTSSVAMETSNELTKTRVTEEWTRTQADNEVDCDFVASPNVCQAVPKSLQKSKPTCSETVNVVKKLFEGTLVLQTRCLSCEGLRQRRENFQDISVPVQNTKSENGCANNLSDSEDESEQDLNLSWAISKFASIERLCGDNKYFCEKCATLTEADISTYFDKLPQVLTIHLKRFQTSYGSQSLFSSNWVTKVTKSLDTPQQLSLKKWCSKTCSEKNAMYQLFGVVMHSGMSSCSGHYLSYVNVDILKRQSDERMMSSCSSGSVQDEAVGNGENEMQVDDASTKLAHSTEARSSVENRQGSSVKWGSCESSATKLCDADYDSATFTTTIQVSKESDNKNDCKNETNSSYDEGLECHTKGSKEGTDDPCERNNIEDEDLCCEESLDADDDDKFDLSGGIKDLTELLVKNNASDTVDTGKSNEDNPRRMSLRKRIADTVKKADDSESSSDEDDKLPIPRSMDITRYFKPIPKSKSSTTNFGGNPGAQSSSRETCDVKLSKESSSGDDEIESCSQIKGIATNVTKLNGAAQESRSSAFSVFEKRTASTVPKSSEESSNQEKNDQSHSPRSPASNTSNNEEESERLFEKGQFSGFESHPTSRNEVQNGHSVGEDGKNKESCPQAKECSEHKNDRSRDPEKYNPCTKPITNQEVHSTENNFTPISDKTLFPCEDTRSDNDSNVLSSTWLKFDDAEVQEISARKMNEILSPSTSCYSTPYLLFYYRC